MTDYDSERLLFRVKHIIPRSISSTGSLPFAYKKDGIVGKSSGTEPGCPQDVEFQMTWGKVAGIDQFIYQPTVSYL